MLHFYSIWLISDKFHCSSTLKETSHTVTHDCPYQCSCSNILSSHCTVLLIDPFSITIHKFASATSSISDIQINYTGVLLTASMKKVILSPHSSLLTFLAFILANGEVIIKANFNIGTANQEALHIHPTIDLTACHTSL